MNRHPRKKLDAHLAWLRTLPSLVNGTGPVEAAHIRFAAAPYAKPQPGIGAKPDDTWTVPLAAGAHREQHSGSERGFWQRHNINPLIIAAFLWLHSGNDEAGTTIIRNAKGIAPWSTVA